MVINRKCLAFCCGLLVLAACGGGGGGEQSPNLSNTRPPPAGAPSFDDLIEQGDSLSDIWDGIAPSDPANLPAGGSARYHGAMRVGIDIAGAHTELAGVLAVTARFGDDALIGSVSGISRSDGQEYSGKLTLRGGFIDRTADVATEYTFGGDLDGTLAGKRQTLVVDGLLEGDFLDTDHRAATGVVQGSVWDGADNGTFVGDFIAQR